MIGTTSGPADDVESGIYSAQADLLLNIIELHLLPIGVNKFQLDTTYGKGNFYRKTRVPEPHFRFDIDPKFEDVEEADCRAIPLKDESILSAIFDPPFIHAHGKESIIGNQFSSYKSQKLLHEMYTEALWEHYRVLNHRGVLVFKTMDIVESGKQVWSHIKIANVATHIGFVLDDLFILVAGHRIQGHNHARQQHARKHHVYFLVLKKK